MKAACFSNRLQKNLCRRFQSAFGSKVAIRKVKNSQNDTHLNFQESKVEIKLDKCCKTLHFVLSFIALELNHWPT